MLSWFFQRLAETKSSEVCLILYAPGRNTDSVVSFLLVHIKRWAFCTAGATIVSGCVAERVKSPTYALFAFCMTSFIYPVTRPFLNTFLIRATTSGVWTMARMLFLNGFQEQLRLSWPGLGAAAGWPTSSTLATWTLRDQERLRGDAQGPR